MPLRDKNDEAPPRLCGRKPPLITTVEMEKELPATDPMRVICSGGECAGLERLLSSPAGAGQSRGAAGI